ncbi:SGNH/GDSL hydrolase family protein [Clostridium yunnanense]|uniref:SGNH/GDSL hydrolase family protein n=1 Tax=Clostridium yunnanense TaxID=2800325 RepID=UPI001A9C7A28|nr:SGNH/GDSL hydrolase family protein [Clostridium yunnanense]
MKLKKKKGIIILVIALIIVISSAVYNVNKYLGWFREGNSAKYSLENVQKLDNSPIANKNIIFLGSSVTLGKGSRDVSFVDYIEKKDSVSVTKEAVSGTTLVDKGKDSYIQRMKNKLDTKAKVDAFVCQLSTNDASQKQPLGKINTSMNLKDFDTSTITGAMEYIICYAKQNWNCKVIFYTETKYESKEYEAMVTRLLELQKKWNIGVIDMWNDNELNNINEKTRKLYMLDNVHPLKAGYLEWWTPYIEKYLYGYLQQ